jgi:hypothetical protein
MKIGVSGCSFSGQAARWASARHSWRARSNRTRSAALKSSVSVWVMRRFVRADSNNLQADRHHDTAAPGCHPQDPVKVGSLAPAVRIGRIDTYENVDSPARSPRGRNIHFGVRWKPVIVEGGIGQPATTEILALLRPRVVDTAAALPRLAMLTPYVCGLVQHHDFGKFAA